MDSLKRWREPAAWVVLASLAVGIVLALADLAVFPGPAPVLASGLAYRTASPTMIIVLAALVATCVLTDRTPRARLLTLLSMITAGVAVLVSLILAAIGLASGSPTAVVDLLSVLAALAIPVVGLGLLIKLFALQPAPEHAAAVAVATPPPAIAAPPLPPPNPQFQPTWQPDAAAGAVWRTAGEAASGAPASGWGQPGPDAGWQPIPTATGVPPYPTADPAPVDPAGTGEDPTARRWSN